MSVRSNRDTAYAPACPSRTPSPPGHEGYGRANSEGVVFRILYATVQPWRSAVADGTGSIGATHRPLRDKVVGELRRRIIDGVYEPGDRLTEDRLAVDFGVSR